MGINWTLWGHDSSLPHSNILKSGWLQWLTISRHCCCHSNRTWFTITFVPMDKKLLFYWCLHYITVCLPSPRRSYPMVFMHAVQCSHFLIERHSVWNSLQFFQWLVMLQCSGQSYGSSVSQLIEAEAVARYKHTTTNKFNFSVAMAMMAPHHHSSHWYCFILHMAIGIVVAIATEHVCHISSIQKLHIPAATILTIEHNFIHWFQGEGMESQRRFPPRLWKMV